MAGTVQKSRVIVTDLVKASRKRRQIAAEFKRNGLHSLKRGASLAYRGRDIASGFIVEGSPLDTYISTFILPAFDKLEFISWSLGDRIVHCSADIDTPTECKEAFAYYQANLMNVRSPEDLLKYLDEREIKGFYPVWVRYLCYLRIGDISRALEYLNDVNIGDLSETTIDKFLQINQYAVKNDETAIERVLADWTLASDRVLGHFDREFSAFSGG